jgi:hypothetical protein
MKRAWSDGTATLELSPAERVEKLAALVPPPHANQIVYRTLDDVGLLPAALGHLGPARPNAGGTEGMARSLVQDAPLGLRGLNKRRAEARAHADRDQSSGQQNWRCYEPHRDTPHVG